VHAICVAKENTELLEKINKALGELKADGTIDTIVGKYIKAN
jgi:polar amino acid transport system substrate-binding protein